MNFHKTAETLIKGARTLPRKFYIEPDNLNQEFKKIFHNNWISIGRSSDLSTKGQYITIQIGNESVIILKSEKDKTRAFYGDVISDLSANSSHILEAEKQEQFNKTVDVLQTSLQKRAAEHFPHRQRIRRKVATLCLAFFTLGVGFLVRRLLGCQSYLPHNARTNTQKKSNAVLSFFKAHYEEPPSQERSSQAEDDESRELTGESQSNDAFVLNT